MAVTDRGPEPRPPATQWRGGLEHAGSRGGWWAVGAGAPDDRRRFASAHKGRSVGVHHVPQTPVVVEALTAGRPGLRVTGEVVEGMAVEGDLLTTVGSRRRSRLAAGESGADLGGP